jgi:hypothetical protein
MEFLNKFDTQGYETEEPEAGNPRFGIRKVSLPVRRQGLINIAKVAEVARETKFEDWFLGLPSETMRTGLV